MPYYILVGNIMLLGITMLIWDRYRVDNKIENCIEALDGIKSSVVRLKEYIESLEKELDSTKIRNRELSRLIREQKNKEIE
jgi:hypothetical protein